MNWQGRKVLLTGAGGFIGSHLAEQLVARGAAVRAFVRYTSRRDVGLLRLVPPDVFREMEVVAGDLRDADAVRAAAHGCQTVFHLGALISIPYSYVHPREVVETNVLGTLNVLEAVRASGAERLVHTSSSEVYGTARRVPIDEAHPLQGQSPYSASKIGADRVVESYWRAFATPVVTLRPFNTYGPRQSARAVIPTIITQALAGDEVRLGNLHPTRDFTFVADTVAAFLAVAEADGVSGEEINVGAGAEIAIGDLVQKIALLMGRPLRAVATDARKRPEHSEVERLLADAQKAKRLLGWAPKVNLDDGLAQTIQWIREHLDLYQPGVYQV
ncbi:MAG: NAD-dependent epimerase/dehydratase family protein [Planctomycetes bacterium]|nr:NAD-dependent epimerase/dehydratase family protein [Planctomycetota bacterium]